MPEPAIPGQTGAQPVSAAAEAQPAAAQASVQAAQAHGLALLGRLADLGMQLAAALQADALA